MKNKPLSAYKKKKLIESFCDELTATQAAHRLNLDRNTINKYFKRIRICIAGYREYHKMRILVSLISSPGRKAETVTTFLQSSSKDDPIEMQIMFISGQVLTEIPLKPKEEIPASLLPVTQFANLNFNDDPDVQQNIDVPKADLENIAKDFKAFAAGRFKKYYGIRDDHAYLYLKEAEFVFNEKDPAKREKLLQQMSDHIF